MFSGNPKVSLGIFNLNLVLLKAQQPVINTI